MYCFGGRFNGRVVKCDLSENGRNLSEHLQVNVRYKLDFRIHTASPSRVWEQNTALQLKNASKTIPLFLVRAPKIAEGCVEELPFLRQDLFDNF